MLPRDDATPLVESRRRVILQAKDDNLRRYYEAHGTNLLVDYARREEKEKGGVRLVCANEDWTALVPFWATWPYETMVLPRRRRLARMEDLKEAERDSLADIMKRLATRY